jgi:hypothetical protein
MKCTQQTRCRLKAAAILLLPSFRRVCLKAIRSVARVAFFAGRETRNSEFPGDAGRQQTGFVFLGARTPQFTWQNDAGFARTVELDPASVAEPAATVVPPHHGKHWPPDWKKKTAFLPEMAAS